MSHVSVVIVLLAALASYAEGVGPRVEIYFGGLSGMMLGAVGILFSVLVWRRHCQAKNGKTGRWDIWTLWVSGFLVRIMLLTGLCWIFWRFFEGQVVAAGISMACVFLCLHFWDTFWLYRKFVSKNPGWVESHG